MKILITGSSGFIGQHLCPALQSQAHEIIKADRTHGIDLTDPSQVQALPEVDMVVHLAAHNGTRHFYERPLDVIRDAVLPTQYLIDRYQGKVQRFVFTGTCESYAGAVDLFDWPVPTDERVPLVVSDVTNPRWSYGGSKIVNELQVTAAWSQHGMPYSIIRYHNVYGPGQRDHFIPEFLDRARTGDLTLKGWENTRSFMYVSDAIDATMAVMFSDACRNEIVNIGVDDEIAIRDMAKIILEEAGISGELVLEPAPPGSVKRRCGDVSRLTQLIGFQAKVDIRSGIRKTLASYA
jgi:UDP-glucose 4-epimerase